MLWLIFWHAFGVHNWGLSVIFSSFGFYRYSFCVLQFNHHHILKWVLVRKHHSRNTEKRKRRRKRHLRCSFTIFYIIIMSSCRYIMSPFYFLDVLQRAEDETARLYQEFLESFQADDTPGSKAFVRGGTINPNEKIKNDSEGQLQFDCLLINFHTGISNI